MTPPAGYRRDPFTGRWVLVAPTRGRVPRAPDPVEGLPPLPGPCPFCPGREVDTETALLEVPEVRPWRVRVVANKYPAVLHPPDEGETAGGADDRWQPPHGAHEVVVESPDHDQDLPDMKPAQLIEILSVYRDRVRVLERVPGVRHVSVFRNRGRRAGSSQPHPHGQVLAAAVVGPEVEARQEAAHAHARRRAALLIDDVTARERAEAARIVHADERVTVFCPFAPSHAFETWIVPRACHGSFADASGEALAAVADVLPDLVRRVLGASGRSDYGLVIRQPAVDAPPETRWWHLEILPRPGLGAGFELSAGIRLVSTAPEEAAARVRASNAEHPA